MRAPDISILDGVKTIVDQQQLQDAFELKKALAAQEIKKAGELDITKLGQQAFIKASQGLPLDPRENAALQYLDNKEQTTVFNPATGAIEQKPSLLQRAGFNLQQPAKAQQPMQAPASAPTKSLSAGVAPSFQKYMTGEVTPEVPVPSNSPDYLTGLNPAKTANPKLTQKKLELDLADKAPGAMFEKENKLRDEFTNNTKTFRELRDAYSKSKKLSDTAAGDIALLYATAKLNDPGSVVRESEFAVQASAGSFGDRIQNLVGKIQTGQRLTPQQRQQLLAETDNLYNGQLEGYEQMKGQYNAMANEYGLNPKNIIVDYSIPNNKPQSPTGLQEGATATNPKTGQKITFRNGQWQ